MSPQIHQLLNDLNEQLNFSDLENDDPIRRCENAIQIIIISLEKLKVLFYKEKRISQEQEIYFFKNVKPKFSSKLIYYNLIYKIETKMPYGGDKIIKEYLNNELLKLKLFFSLKHKILHTTDKVSLHTTISIIHPLIVDCH